MTRMAITGAAGFVGSHLTEAVLQDGGSVVAIDAMTDYYDPRIKERNASGFRSHPRCDFLEADLVELDLPGVLADVDAVAHLAAQPGVRASWGDEFDVYTAANVTSTQRMLEAAREAKLKKFVFASSSSVYGDAEELPTSEDTPMRPLSPYGATKALGEHLAHLYWRAYDVPVVTLRYFTVFGPRQRPDMAFHRMIHAVTHDSEITVYGDGNQTRDFTFVADAVAGTLAAVTAGRAGRTYNLGGGTRVSVNEVLELVGGMIGSTPRVRHAQRQLGDARDTGADTTRAREELAFEPRHDLAGGLQQQIAWQRTAGA